MRIKGIWLLLCCLTSFRAYAQTIEVSLTDDKGQAVADAIVAYEPTDATGLEVTPNNEQSVTQKNKSFIPFVTVVPIDSTVTFTNEDSVLHHVFSFSKAKRFDLKLFGASEPQTVLFDAPGIVSVGCNIHDGMIAYVFVSQSPYTAQTDENGKAVLTNVPAGAGAVTIWHPLLKGKGNLIRQQVTVSPQIEPILASAKFRKGARRSSDY